MEMKWGRLVDEQWAGSYVEPAPCLTSIKCQDRDDKMEEGCISISCDN